ncbi:hypothetical protein [Jannaschia sp. W003]|uniref:hypothetical protein n=1 Tax=Jannaschia sp. W003 TaxID=2867012 RepID=UPI0021A52C87|nr:hypothetical protein [Jannaschia sp. W003]UWQ20646.1 hypothetical protein K3554_11725 [Jannaschia sp. W003]
MRMAASDAHVYLPTRGAVRGAAFAFFGFGALCVTGGMLWGIAMAATGDHAAAGAHAHLNLVGWVTMGLFGLYYALTPPAAASRLAWVHFAFAASGVILLVPGIFMAVTGRSEGLAIAGSFVTLASMLLFLFVLARHGFGRGD